ncbi:MAG: hypothetical protein B5M54_03780 [Candidatus Aminicenantes bacterium 4484_214]|nr:MAG: hypothetical protein B5M54_03780 [Candidatus Aminicenantes bacterium 4484_214]
MRRKIILIAWGLVFFLAGMAGLIWLSFYLSRPHLSDEFFLDQLQEPVEIYIDSYGVTHIFAQNEEDLFLACGFIHARDRMWHMDFNRHLGLGRLTEIFGAQALKTDLMMRTFGLKETVTRDWELLTPREKRLLEKYSAGVNAWLEQKLIWAEPEFVLLRYRPRPWTPQDSLVIKALMALSLSSDATSEAIRSKILKEKGPEVASQLFEEEIKSFPDEVIKADLAKDFLDFILGASNNWVLSGKRTVSGYPLLANDPHLRISLPSVWYEIHLSCPQWSAIGVSMPGIPLVVIGHNRDIAWGFTYSGVDVQDLSGEVLDETKQFYLRQGEWKPLIKKKELFWIKGQAEPQEIIIDWTEEGPLVTPFLFTSSQPLSLRWVIYEGDKSFEAFYRLNRAQNWEEFKAALSLFGAPSQNIVYADKQGNIGYYLSGKIPIRHEEAGLFVLPRENEKTQWSGYIPEEEKPIIYNPPSGMIVTANNRVVPEDYPYYLGQEWDVGYRARRIEELLNRQKTHDIASLAAIQQDVKNLLAQPLVNLIRQYSFRRPEAIKAQEILRDWEGRIDGGREAALFEVFIHQLWKNLYAKILGEDFAEYYHLFRRKKVNFHRLAQSLESSPELASMSWLPLPAHQSFREVCEQSLTEAFLFLQQRFGPLDHWQWSNLHVLELNHFLGRKWLFAFFNSHRLHLDGDLFTVKATFGREFGVSWAPSYRQIIDLSNWDSSVAVFSSGNSGHFLSEFYDNQASLWLEGKYHPLFFSLDNIKKHVRGRIYLSPAKDLH